MYAWLHGGFLFVMGGRFRPPPPSEMLASNIVKALLDRGLWRMIGVVLENYENDL